MESGRQALISNVLHITTFEIGVTPFANKKVELGTQPITYADPQTNKLLNHQIFPSINEFWVKLVWYIATRSTVTQAWVQILDGVTPIFAGISCWITTLSRSRCRRGCISENYPRCATPMGDSYRSPVLMTLAKQHAEILSQPATSPVDEPPRTYLKARDTCLGRRRRQHSVEEVIKAQQSHTARKLSTMKIRQTTAGWRGLERWWTSHQTWKRHLIPPRSSSVLRESVAAVRARMEACRLRRDEPR